MSQTYIIVGDSWSMGEFSAEEFGPPIHRGLAQYLEDDGHRVISLSLAGISNWDQCHKLTAWFERHDEKVDGVFAFQTGFEKDLKYTYNHAYRSLEDLIMHYLFGYYQRLSGVYKKYGVPVYVIGSKCDAMLFDDIEQTLPGVNIVCQSLFNLLLYNDPDIDEPVYSWFDRTTINMVKQLHSSLGSDELARMLDHIDRGGIRDNMVSWTTEWYWPDGAHLNRHAYRKLYDFLRDQGIVP